MRFGGEGEGDGEGEGEGEGEGDGDGDGEGVGDGEGDGDEEELAAIEVLELGLGTAELDDAMEELIAELSDGATEVSEGRLDVLLRLGASTVAYFVVGLAVDVGVMVAETDEVVMGRQVVAARLTTLTLLFRPCPTPLSCKLLAPRL